jgi:hypothetical protein
VYDLAGEKDCIAGAIYPFNWEKEIKNTKSRTLHRCITGKRTKKKAEYCLNGLGRLVVHGQLCRYMEYREAQTHMHGKDRSVRVFPYVVLCSPYLDIGCHGS